LNLLTEIQCFGSISFWIELIKSEVVILEQYERFQKSGYRNRFWILDTNGPLLLSIPIVGGRNNHDFIRDVKIDYTTKWQKQHWRALESAYNKSPFFLYYQDFLQDLILGSRFTLLWDFNWEALTWLNRTLKADCKIKKSEGYEKNPDPQNIVDYRSKEKPGNHFQFKVPEYYQVFGDVHVSNLSILDLLFNLGPASLEKLKTQI
jgi:hypothetical protein